MKTLTTLLATAALALAAGCAPTTATNDQASLGAVSGTSSCSAEKASCSSAQKASCSSAQKASCSSAQKAACAASCASKTAAAKTITCPLTGKQIDPADCPANTDKPSLGAVEGTKTKSGCCANKAKAAGCPFSKKSE